ncbi:Tol-Pal system beta propeller repeat protein TolB [Sodalis sp. CWE]|uniref:Tol-Pal system beta propeller repeat protein TolB n=1 Tax=Sodalis sp. CWE TaxID=2803816 RepID=UPI001C7CBC47|nr:Tol-Pal system beta propeller repeat protein TolB [Sodalis sp. CWE]MBX4180942.1 Tol-Pal system protein TolB [Sodalis sp. CWE]
MRQIIRIIISFLFLCISMQNIAEIHIEITQGVNLARPIGIVPFKWETKTDNTSGYSECISEVIASDLRNSGKFNPLDVADLPQYPSTASEVKSKDWMTIGIDIVVVGRVYPSSENSYIVSYQLVDTSNHLSSSILEQNEFKVRREWLRYAGHSTSDEVFEKLTGIKGAFRTRIAYVVKTKNERYPYELRVADYDGQNQIPVHLSSQPLMSPSWSSDGNKLAYVTFESGRSALVIQTLDSGIVRQVASFQQHNGAPSFSPDGKKLAFALSKTGSLNLYVMDLESEKIYQVTHDRSNNTEPKWFPDSQTLAYTSDQGGAPQIYKININNNGIPQRLSWIGSRNQNADISLDGKFLVMVNNNNDMQNIARLDLETGIFKILTNTFLDETPSISPNGVMIIYSTSQGLSSKLRLISSDGRFQTCLPIIDGQGKFPTWSPYF